MPRKAKRPPQQVGRPTPDYSNRTDMAVPPSQPVRVPAGRGYGEATALESAQQAAPLPQSAAPGMDLASIVSAGQGMPFPEETLGSPSTRPTEPLTAGLPFGPGPGPEILGRIPGAPTAAATFARLAAIDNDPELAELSRVAEQQGA
jgi:hypothetical protein